MTHTDYGHHEEDHLLGHEHTHEHKLITFFSKIFSSEETSDHDGVFFNYTFDKHFAQEYPPIDFKKETSTKHNFFYVFHIPKSVKTILSPPPETFFS